MPKQKTKIPDGWMLKKIGDVLTYEQPNKYIVKSTSYNNDYQTPVLTANKSFILGYTNEDFGICNDVPVIIFDDFTTDSKYVDFSFKVKSSAIKILRCCDNSTNLKFIYEIMKTIQFPIGNHKRYYISQYQNLDIIVPPLVIQNKIADILGAVDGEIEKVDSVIEKSKKIKGGLMKKLFKRGIRHTEFKKTKIGNIPKEWDVVSLQTLINNKLILGHLDGNHGGLYPKSNEFVNSGVPYLSANCINDGVINFKKTKFLSPERASKFIKGVALNGDVIFAHNATVGPVAILHTEEKYVILSTTLTYYRCNTNKLVPSFLRYYMESSLFSEQYKRVMAQSTRNQVPITTQRTFLFVVPTYKEQREIAEIFSSMDNKISIYKKIKNNLIQLKKGLMTDLLSGNKIFN